MATESADNGNAEETTGSVPGLAYTVAVGGDPKAKTRRYIGRQGRVTSRYLRPKIASCHDRCKSRVRDETPELKKPGRILGVRKIWVKKKPVRRSVEPVERKKIVKTKPKPIPRHKIGAPDEPTNRKSTQNVKQKPSSLSIFNGQKNEKEIKNIKNTGIVGKSTYAEQVATKGTHTGSSPRKYKPKSPRKDEESMTKAKLKHLLAEKITEITSHEAEVEEVELVPPTVDIIEAPLEDEYSATETKPKRLIAKMITEMTLQKAVNAELESTNLPSSESSQSCSDKQVSEEDHGNANNEEVNVSEDDDKMVNCEDKENEGSKVKFMRGRVVEAESEDDPRRLNFRRGKILDGNEDDGPTRLNFRRGKILDGNEDDGPTRLNFREGTILEDNDDDESNAKMNFKKTIIEEATDDGKRESEAVTLKHQQMQEKKEAQDLLNRVIEETASKLEVDRKNKVEALVGAFESVISLRDNTPSSQ